MQFPEMAKNLKLETDFKWRCGMIKRGNRGVIPAVMAGVNSNIQSDPPTGGPDVLLRQACSPSGKTTLSIWPHPGHP